MESLGKGLLLIGDGLGDRPSPDLGGRTPLEAANKPVMDRMAAEGQSGMLDPIAPGIRAGSDTAHLSILGYDPFQLYPGRGPFEAMGIGLDVQRGDVAFRCNFSTVDDQMVVTDRRAGRITGATAALAEAVNGIEVEGVLCLFKESVAHRGGLVLRAPGLGDRVSDADPHAEGERVHDAHGADPASEKTARAVNAFVRRTYEILRDHPVNRDRIARGLPPANVILPRGGGSVPHLRPFKETTGLNGACIVEVGLVKGIGRYIGMDVIDVVGATAGLDTDVMAIGRAVANAMQTHDFVLCNVKGPDVAGHDRNARGKVEIIEKMDAMLGWLLPRLPERAYVAITGDHTTPVTVGDHTGEPVPFLLWGPDLRTDDVTAFGERPSARGSLGRIRGMEILPIMTSWMGTQEKFGA